jgi:hypothetical protein
MYKGENSHAVDSQSEYISRYDARKHRRERLSRWFEERGIRMSHVAAEIGVSNAVASSALRADAATLESKYRDRLIALGVPADLLPPERLSREQPACPMWPNPEASIASGRKPSGGASDF